MYCVMFNVYIITLVEGPGVALDKKIKKKSIFLAYNTPVTH